MSAGDVIVAIDGLRATHANLDKLLQFRTPGEAVEIHAFRRDELRVFRVLLAPAPADTCWLAFRGGKPSPAALAWLCGRED
jgi:predicted metalloprotease with PDZ domain